MGSPVTDSGEIILKLDWSQLSDGYSYDTFQVAAAVVPALLSTNFLPQLGGHALVEMPLHLIGHSRGGSLVAKSAGYWARMASGLTISPPSIRIH